MLSNLIPILQAEGHRIASQHPLNDVNDAVATVVKAIGLVSGPDILVGHSYGGTLITAAGIDDRVAPRLHLGARP
jgi:thioesterase domain-containing protein